VWVDKTRRLEQQGENQSTTTHYSEMARLILIITTTTLHLLIP
jgi:hypothetical protein